VPSSRFSPPRSFCFVACASSFFKTAASLSHAMSSSVISTSMAQLRNSASSLARKMDSVATLRMRLAAYCGRPKDSIAELSSSVRAELFVEVGGIGAPARPACRPKRERLPKAESRVIVHVRLGM